MIRMIQNQSAASGKAYFTDSLSKSDYYIADTELAGIYGGRLAERLGLKGAITKEEFFALCDNINPANNSNLTPETRLDRTVFYDINFQVPKSVSIVNALSKDDHIVTAFRESFYATMAEIEADSLTRVRLDGKHEDRKSGELLFVEFLHHTARPVDDFAPDPLLHIHGIVINAAWDPVEHRIKACQFREIQRNMPYYQAVFDKHLADRLQHLGYEIRRTRSNFEIANVPQAGIDLFSKRAKQIEKVAKQKGITGAKQLAELGAKTRAKKQKGMSMAELKANWRKQALEHNIQPEPDKPIRWGNPQVKDLVTTKDCIDYSLKHCFERKSVMPERRILLNALRHSLGNQHISIDSIKQEFNADKRFIRIDNANYTECTTQDILKEEMQMVTLAQKGFGAVKPLYKESLTLELDTQQANAVNHILTSYDRVNIIRGAAGSGKTTLMKEAVRHMNKAGKQVFTVAPTSEASRGVLQSEGFKDATTVAALLSDINNHSKLRDQVIWADEAGLLSMKEMTGLLKLANQHNARLILGGDVKQHSSVARGDALRVLQKVGNIPVAEVNKIYRQKKYDYRNAVEQIAKGDITSGFKKLDSIGFIKTIDPKDPHKQLISDYITAVKAGKTALVISPTHKEGEAVTEEIRKVMRNEKMIGEKEITINKLSSLNLTEAEKADWRNYKEGNIIQFSQNVKGIKRGSKWKVAGIEEQYIRLQDKEGATRSLPLDKPLTYDVFNEREMNVSVGDKIKITRNGIAERKRSPKLDDYLTLYSKKQQIKALESNIEKTISGEVGKHLKNGQRKKSIEGKYKRLNRLKQSDAAKIDISNGQLLEVASISRKGKIELKSKDGKARYLLDREYGHLTHAHCLTSHASQGKTVDRVFIYQPASTFEATTEKQFYVSASRGREKAFFYTDDKKGLLDHVNKISDRQSAIELVSKHKDHQEHMEHLQRSYPVKQKQVVKEKDKGVKRARFEDRDYEPGF